MANRSDLSATAMCRLALEKLARRPDEVRALARANLDV
jgi:hypothetical protein